MKKNLLVIDDDDFFAVHLERIFGDHFSVVHEWNGHDGVLRAAAMQPDVILLDVEMSEIDGYAVCRMLKERDATREIPVIFISAYAETDDRLAGYDAGGDDYMGKPPAPDELQRKIEVVLRNRERSAAFAAQFESASKAAKAAMASVGEAGVILNLMRKISGYTSFSDIAEATINVLAGKGLEASIQLRAKQGTLSRKNAGFCSPLEESVLNTMSNCARIVDLGRRSAFNFERVSIIVENMPREDVDRNGMLKDTMSIIAEVVDIHMGVLDITFEAISRGDTLLELLHRNAGLLREIEAGYRNQREQSADILDKLVNEIEDSFIFLGLSENQERFLQNLARDAVAKAQALYGHAIETDKIMQSLGDGLHATLQQELQGAADASSQTENRIELF